MSIKTEAQHILNQVESIKNGSTDYKDIVRELEEIQDSALRIIKEDG